MANYAMKDARFTAIYRRETRVEKGGKKDVFFLVPFELVRYNVDVPGEQEPVIIPIGQRISTGSVSTKTDEKIYEKIWVVDVVPFHVGRGGKHDFGKQDDEGNVTRQGD
jgi:hypothetical protein